MTIRRALNFLKCFPIWFAAFSCLGAAACGEPNEFTLPVQILNNADVADNVLRGARGHVDQIFAGAGIRITWDRKISPFRVSVILLDKEGEAGLDLRDTGICGLAIGHDGRDPRRAYVFSHRVKQYALTLRLIMLADPDYLPNPTVVANRRLTEELVLGYVIAHEIGHLMLPVKAHSPAGIMLPGIGYGNLHRVLGQQPKFLPKQIQLIRSSISGLWGATFAEDRQRFEHQDFR